MSFKYIGTLADEFGPILKKVVLKNSFATSRGDALRVNAGFVDAPTSVIVFGHLIQHVSNDGISLTNDGAGSAFGTYAGTFTTAADNQTVAKVCAQLDISKLSKFEGDVDADIPATSLYMTRMNLADKATLTATGAPVTGGTYAFHEKVAVRKAIVSIAISQLFN